jgi:predicted DCC family thiol-disulfide oxidoreductase YuxK
MPDTSYPIAVMDGTCALCAFGARLVHRLDRSGTIRIAPIQGYTGRKLMQAHGLDALIRDRGCSSTQTAPCTAILMR